jgi:cytochrome P450
MADTITHAQPAARAVPPNGDFEALRTNGVPRGAPISPASAIDLSTLDITDPELWRRDAFWDRFARMRKEEPVHYCPDSPFGPYWSLTKYDDIFACDTNHQFFSSYPTITIVDQNEEFPLPMFIAMDPPKHDIQRATVQSIVGPDNLKSYETLIRSRTQALLDGLPVGESFDWVKSVSVELTTMMLATLFDFPFEDRAKLTRWSDVTTGRANPEICPGGEDQWRGRS